MIVLLLVFVQMWNVTSCIPSFKCSKQHIKHTMKEEYGQNAQKVCEEYCQLYMYYGWNGEWWESIQNFNGETYWADGDERIILEWIVVECVGRCKLDWTVLNEMYLLHSYLLVHLDWFYCPEQQYVVWVCISLGEMIGIPGKWLVWEQTTLRSGADCSHKPSFSCKGLM